MSVWTWERVQKALKLIPELNFLRDFHVTQAGVMAASAFGGMKDAKTIDFMHPGSLPDGAKRQGSTWEAFRLESKAAQADFRIAVSLGMVSQHVFDALTL